MAAYMTPLELDEALLNVFYENEDDFPLLSDVIATFADRIDPAGTPSFAQMCLANAPNMTVQDLHAAQDCAYYVVCHHLGTDTYDLPALFPTFKSYLAADETNAVATLATRLAVLCGCARTMKITCGHATKAARATKITKAACMTFLATHPEYYHNTLNFLIYEQ